LPDNTKIKVARKSGVTKVEWAGGIKVDRMRRWDANIVKMYMYIFD
jgi:hypothetical protein